AGAARRRWRGGRPRCLHLGPTGRARPQLRITGMRRSMSASDELLITVSGKDSPGITARLTGVLAQHGAEVLDIDQVVLHGRLTLCLRVAMPTTHGALRDLLVEAKALGVTLDLEPLQVAAGQLDAAKRWV